MSYEFRETEELNDNQRRARAANVRDLSLNNEVVRKAAVRESERMAKLTGAELSSYLAAVGAVDQYFAQHGAPTHVTPEDVATALGARLRQFEPFPGEGIA